jgi:hypothetical protein
MGGFHFMAVLVKGWFLYRKSIYKRMIQMIQRYPNISGNLHILEVVVHWVMIMNHDVMVRHVNRTEMETGGHFQDERNEVVLGKTERLIQSCG